MLCGSACGWACGWASVLLVERVDRVAVRVIWRWAPRRACGSAVWLVVGWAAGYVCG